jgi:hypothetical protein
LACPKPPERITLRSYSWSREHPEDRMRMDGKSFDR